MQLGCSGVEIYSYNLEFRPFETPTPEVMKAVCFPYEIRLWKRVGFTYSIRLFWG
jgi:hypothetical protein